MTSLAESVYKIIYGIKVILSVKNRHGCQRLLYLGASEKISFSSSEVNENI